MWVGILSISVTILKIETKDSKILLVYKIKLNPLCTPNNIFYEKEIYFLKQRNSEKSHIGFAFLQISFLSGLTQ